MAAIRPPNNAHVAADVQSQSCSVTTWVLPSATQSVLQPPSPALRARVGAGTTQDTSAPGCPAPHSRGGGQPRDLQRARALKARRKTALQGRVSALRTLFPRILLSGAQSVLAPPAPASHARALVGNAQDTSALGSPVPHSMGGGQPGEPPAPPLHGVLLTSQPTSTPRGRVGSGGHRCQTGSPPGWLYVPCLPGYGVPLSRLRPPVCYGTSSVHRASTRIPSPKGRYHWFPRRIYSQARTTGTLRCPRRTGPSDRS